MPDYLVIWKINLSAATPQEAVGLAREIQLDPGSWATNFTVVDTATGDSAEVNTDDD